MERSERKRMSKGVLGRRGKGSGRKKEGRDPSIRSGNDLCNSPARKLGKHEINLGSLQQGARP